MFSASITAGALTYHFSEFAPSVARKRESTLISTPFVTLGGLRGHLGGTYFRVSKLARSTLEFVRLQRLLPKLAFCFTASLTARTSQSSPPSSSPLARAIKYPNRRSALLLAPTRTFSLSAPPTPSYFYHICLSIIRYQPMTTLSQSLSL